MKIQSLLFVRRFIIAVTFLVAGVMSLSAQTYHWIQTTAGTLASPNLWELGSNWNPVPDPIDHPDGPSGVGVITDFSGVNTANQYIKILDEITISKLIQGGSAARFITGSSDAVLRLEAPLGEVPEISVLDGAIRIDASLAGNQGFSKTGNGNLTLQFGDALATPYAITGATQLTGGSVVLQLNYALYANASGNRYFDPNSSLTLGGVNGGAALTLTAGGITGVVQTVDGLHLDKGYSQISVTGSGAIAPRFELGEITGSWGVLNINTANVYTTTTPTDATGFISPRVIYGGVTSGQWAKVDGNGQLVAFDNADYSSTWGTGNHTKITTTTSWASETQGLVAKSLRLEGASTKVTLPDDVNVIESGGIWLDNSNTIEGGKLTAGAGVSSLVVRGNSNTSYINSAIVDNGAPLNLEIFNGQLNLGGANTFTGGIYVYSGASGGVRLNNRKAVGSISRIEVLASGMRAIEFRGGSSLDPYFLDASRLVITGNASVKTEGASGSAQTPNIFFLGKQDYAGDFSTSTTTGGSFINVDNFANSGEASALGAGSSIDMGSPNPTYYSRLRYIGMGDASTDRALTIRQGNVSLDNSSGDNGDLTFNGTLSFAGGNTPVLRLMGMSTGIGTLQGAIANAPSFATSLQGNARGTWVLNGVNTYTGDTTMFGGTVVATQTVDGTPYGSGNLVLYGGRLALRPDATATGDLDFTGANRAVGVKLSYAGGGTLELNRGTADSLTYTLGNISETGSAFERSGQGVITLSSSTRASLGDTERLILNGTAPTVTNGMVSASIIGQDRSSGSLNGYFLTYDGSDGFKAATPTHSDFTGVDGNSIVEVTTAQTPISGAINVYALSANAASNLEFQDSLTLGSGGLILNGANIKATSLDFGATQGLIYTSSEGGGIEGVISGTAGVVYSGTGVLNLRGNNTHTNNYFNGGLVNIVSVNALGVTPNLTFDGGGLQIAETMTINQNLDILEGGATIDVLEGKRFTLGWTVPNSSKGSLTKSNAGTMVMNATNYSPAGDTIIAGGALRVGDTRANSNAKLYYFAALNSEVQVLGGGELGGHGTIGRSVNVYSGGAVGSSLGRANSQNGILTFEGGYVAFYEGSQLVFNLSGPLDNYDGIAGIDWDLLRISQASGQTSMAFLDGSLVRLDLGSLIPDKDVAFWQNNHRWTIAEALQGSIIENFGLSVLNGNFDAGSFSVTLDASGKNLYLDFAAIPEPSAVALLCGGLAVMIGALLRKRRQDAKSQ